MISLKHLKNAASAVGAVVGIVTGVDKIKDVSKKWHREYKANKKLKKVVPPLE